MAFLKDLVRSFFTFSWDLLGNGTAERHLG
jgi:hypothetical protein